MTVAVELDADPPRLRRLDGLIVRFPPDANGGFPTIEVGWLREREGFELLLRWRGLTYQELQPGTASALLVGHIIGGGYSSAVVALDDSGATFEFADRIPANAQKMQVVEAELDVSPRVDVEHYVADEGGLSFNDEEGDSKEIFKRRIVIERRASTKPLTHVHRLHSRGPR
jgi:hypothetical protein